MVHLDNNLIALEHFRWKLPISSVILKSVNDIGT